MAWVAPIVGYVDHGGILRCTPCATDRGKTALEQVSSVCYGDAWYYEEDVCECCGKQLMHIPSKDYIWQSQGR